MKFCTIEKLHSIFLTTSGICTDTRKISNGSMFFALKGENFNGNRFAAQAMDAGSSYAVVDEEDAVLDDKFLLVPDVLKALQSLARFHRRTLKLKVIGITGSNGKTTSKELVSRVLSQGYNTYATFGNLNNQIGVPLSLLCLNETHEMAVIEMGASKPGDIRELVEIAEPDFGLITSIGKAHLEGMGGIEGVVKTKGELFDFIRENGGGIFLESGNPYLEPIAKGIHLAVRYGKHGADFEGEITHTEPFLNVKWKKRGNPDWNNVESNLTGEYNFSNILSAIAIGSFFGLKPEQIAKGIASYIPDNNRAQFVKKGSNTLILDAYNANPTSMEASIRNFEKQDFPNKILVLGEMMELGDYAEKEHKHILDLVRDLGFTQVHLVGAQFLALKQNGYNFWANAAELSDFFKANPPGNSTILFKGSRRNKLETIGEVL
ncbi:MAG: UDP-N-acetylmuramoyl-tripeptide--D-alanyl-D-alanine ligase [Bacteroidia bacterium]|nr:UDP-N-acetylmuramoyl-tripeptide--D-alanyl-D-alanine ligase [Bacteroidia bacterium]